MRPADQSADGCAGINSYLVLICQWGTFQGKINTVADVLSRFADPASEAYRDISKHGSVQDEDEMEGLILRERMEERGCMYVSAHKESGVKQVSRWFWGEVAVSQTTPISERSAVQSIVTPRGSLSPC